MDDDERPTRPLEKLKIVEILVTIREGVETIRDELRKIQDSPEERQEILAEVQRLKDSVEGVHDAVGDLEESVTTDQSTLQRFWSGLQTRTGMVAFVIVFVLIIVALLVLEVDVNQLVGAFGRVDLPLSTVSVRRIYQEYNADDDEAEEDDPDWRRILTLNERNR